MKKKLFLYSTTGISFLLILVFSGCLKDKIKQTYTINTPVYKTLTEIRAGVKSGPATAIVHIGKIFVKDNYIFLNEKEKGIHIIDDRDPHNPQNIGFISIPGNEDIGVKGSTLYADMYCDLIALDISNLAQVTPTKFVSNVFPDRSGLFSTSTNPDSVQIIVGWTSKDTTINYDPVYPIYTGACPNCLIFTPAPGSSSFASAVAPGASVGTAGSMTRFTAINDYLYTVSNSNLNVFDISKANDPVVFNKLPIGWNIETIYPLGNKLFVGTNNGVLMYDIQSSPGNPTTIGAFVHASGCDPVIADDHYAYVTLSDGTTCGGVLDELDIVDISNLLASGTTVPAAYTRLVKKYPFTHPQGLSKDGSYLFICDGKDGLKIFDANDVTNLKLIDHLNTPTSFDVIAANGLAILLTSLGLYQYNYQDITNIRLVSKISVGAK